MKINIKARLVAAIAKFKATHDIRYYLNGVYVEPNPDGGAILVATNGHAMGIWHDASSEVERPIILSVRKELLTACAGGNEFDKRRLVDKNGRLTVVDKNDAEIYIQGEAVKKVGAEHYEVEGKFPNWRKVVPEIEPGKTQLYNIFQPQYLRLASEAMRIACDGDKFTGLTLRQPAPDKAILVQSGHPDAGGFLSIIMPMRDDIDLSLPAWAKAPKPPEPLPSQPSDAAPPEGDVDPLYDQAVAIVREHQSASISLVQRHLASGYNHAARLLEAMAKNGLLLNAENGGYAIAPALMAPYGQQAAPGTATEEGGAV